MLSPSLYGMWTLYKTTSPQKLFPLTAWHCMLSVLCLLVYVPSLLSLYWWRRINQLSWYKEKKIILAGILLSIAINQSVYYCVHFFLRSGAPRKETLSVCLSTSVYFCSYCAVTTDIQLAIDRYHNFYQNI